MVADVAVMRREYAALKLVIDGLVGMIRARAACNLGTLFRMARDARDAANALASAIERLLFPPVEEPLERRAHGLFVASKVDNRGCVRRWLETIRLAIAAVCRRGRIVDEQLIHAPNLLVLDVRAEKSLLHHHWQMCV